MQTLLADQLTAFEKLRKYKVGALFMEPGTGKTRTAVELVNSIKEPTTTLWLGPYRTIFPMISNTGVIDEINKSGGVKHSIRFCGIETLSSSDRTYLDLYHWCNTNNVFIVVDESLKIKNWNAKRTKRIIELGKLSTYRLILNGTPISRNLLDIWAQMEFLSPKILNMGIAEFKNTFCEWIKITKRFGSRSFTREFIKKYHNVDYLYSLIGHYVYECDLQLEVGKQYIDMDYSLDSDAESEYIFLKENYLDNEKLMAMNNNIFLELTQKMQHVYCCTYHKFDLVEEILKGFDRSKALIYCKFISSREECGKRFPDVRNMSYGMHSYGLNLQDYNVIIFFDKTFDYAQRLQTERRIFRTGQDETCYYYDLTGNCGLERMINENILKKTSLLDYFKRVGVNILKEL